MFPRIEEIMKLDATLNPKQFLDGMRRIDRNISKRFNVPIYDASNYCIRLVSSPTLPYFVDSCIEQYMVADVRYLKYGDTDRIDITDVYTEEDE